MTMRLTIVGCGDAFGSGGRFNTCFKIDARPATILLDCGASSLVALKAHHIDPNAIDAIVLSHLHGDHFGGLPFLLLDAQLLSRRTRPLVIAGPPGTRARLDAALEVLFPRSTNTAWHFAWEVKEIPPFTNCRAYGRDRRGRASLGRPVNGGAPRRWRARVGLFRGHAMDRGTALDRTRR